MPASRCLGPNWLHDKISRGERVIIDGAMGTELEARGVPMNDKAWSGTAVLTHPATVRAAHEDYIAAGAEVIITNTFASGRQNLALAGLDDEFERINRGAVELAIQARNARADQPVAIAGSMCEWVFSDGPWANATRLSDAYRQQAELLAEAGVELLAIEMSSHPVYARLITEAAVATGLPVWLGISCKRETRGDALVGFDPPHTDFDGLVKDLVKSGAGVINVMHSLVDDTDDGLAVVRKYWSGPVGAYPESGHFKMPNWQFVDVIEPDVLVAHVSRWVEQGVQIIGGCCGLSVPHVRALKAAFG